MGTQNDFKTIFLLGLEVLDDEASRFYFFFRSSCPSFSMFFGLFFLYFRLFNTVDNKQMFYIKVCR